MHLLPQALERSLFLETLHLSITTQLPAVLLTQFCQALRTIRCKTSAPAAATPISSAGAASELQPKKLVGSDPSADLHFFAHLLALVSKAMHAALPRSLETWDGKPPESPEAAADLDSSAAGAKGKKQKRRKMQHAVQQSPDPVGPASSTNPLDAIARWIGLACAAGGLLMAAHQLNVYRPNEDSTGSNQNLLAQLASSTCSQVAALQELVAGSADTQVSFTG